MTTEPAVPQPKWWETVVAIGLDFLPGANRVVDLVRPNSLQKRQHAFLERLAADVGDSAAQIDELRERPEYLAFVYRAAASGIETSDELKRTALLRAARKVLRHLTPEEWQVRDLLLAKLAELTPLHLHLLQFLDRPAALGVSDDDFGQAMRSADRVKTIVEVVPALKEHETLVATLLDDLVAKQLVDPVVGVSNPGSGLSLTAFGREFASYVFDDG